MASAFLYVISPIGEEVNLTLKLENLPLTELEITEETKKEIAYEVLKMMKTNGNLLHFVYTEDSVDENVKEKTFDLI